MADRLLTLVRAAVGFDLDMAGVAPGAEGAEYGVLHPPNTFSPFCRYKERLLLTSKLVDFNLFFCYFPPFSKRFTFKLCVLWVSLCIYVPLGGGDPRVKRL